MSTDGRRFAIYVHDEERASLRSNDCNGSLGHFFWYSDISSSLLCHTVQHFEGVSGRFCFEVCRR